MAAATAKLGVVENVVAGAAVEDIVSRQKQEAVLTGGALHQPLSNLVKLIITHTLHGSTRRRRNQFEQLFCVKTLSDV